MSLLFVQCATKEKYIALYTEGAEHPAALYSWQVQGQEAAHVLPGILSVLEEHKQTFHDVHAVIAVTGPGSFTGLRVTLTVLNTMAYVYPHIRLHGVTMGELLAVLYPKNESRFVLSPYPSDFFLFQGDGAFLGRLSPDVYHAENGDRFLGAGEEVPSVQGSHVAQLQALHDPVEMLVPFYGKGANITTPKNR